MTVALVPLAIVFAVVFRWLAALDPDDRRDTRDGEKETAGGPVGWSGCYGVQP